MIQFNKYPAWVFSSFTVLLLLNKLYKPYASHYKADDTASIEFLVTSILAPVTSTVHRAADASLNLSSHGIATAAETEDC